MILHLLIGHLNIVVAEHVIWNQVLSIFVHLNAAPLYLCVCVQITIIVIIMNNDDKDTDIHAPHLMVAQSTYTEKNKKYGDKYQRQIHKVSTTVYYCTIS